MKKSISIAVIAVLFLPLFANASWWNPISWFSFLKPKPVVIEKVVYVEATPSPTLLSTAAASQKPVISNVAKPTVKVQSPPVNNPVVIPTPTQTAQVSIPISTPIPIQTQNPLDVQKLHDAEQAKRDKVKLDEEAYVSKLKATDFSKTLEIKQAKLDAINLKIANLNAKYNEDLKKINLNVDGGFGFSLEIQRQDLGDKYTSDFNDLKTEYQQVKYSN